MYQIHMNIISQDLEVKKEIQNIIDYNQKKNQNNLNIWVMKNSQQQIYLEVKDYNKKNKIL